MVSFYRCGVLNFAFEGQVGELIGSQAMARQCLVAAITQYLVDLVVVEKDPIPQQLKFPKVVVGTE